MNQLVLHDYGFELIPPQAEKEFIKIVNKWYEDSEFEDDIPLFDNFMIFDGDRSQGIMVEFYYELRSYLYATRYDKMVFPLEEFPVNDQKFLDYQMEYQQECIDLLYEMEGDYVKDMKKYLNMNRMFHSDRYSDEILWHKKPKIQFINMPISEVW